MVLGWLRQQTSEPIFEKASESTKYFLNVLGDVVRECEYVVEHNSDGLNG